MQRRRDLSFDVKIISKSGCESLKTQLSYKFGYDGKRESLKEKDWEERENNRANPFPKKGFFVLRQSIGASATDDGHVSKNIKWIGVSIMSNGKRRHTTFKGNKCFAWF